MTTYPAWRIGGASLNTIDGASNGTLFLRTSTALYRSYNGGTNWTNVLDAIGNGVVVVFDNDTILCAQELTSTCKIYMSYDLGESWVHTLTTSTGQVWDVCISRAPNGDIFLGEYSAAPQKGMNVHHSYDGGLTWASTNMSALIGDYTNYSHVHAVYAPDANTVYASMGDGRQLPVRSVWKSVDRGVTWSKMTNFDAPTAIFQIGSTIYLGTDSGGGVLSTTDWLSFDQLLWGDELNSSGMGWGTGIEFDSVNDVLYYATSGGSASPGSIFFSPDRGQSWGKLFEGKAINSVRIVDSKLYFCEILGEAYSVDLLTQAAACHMIGNYRHNTGTGQVYDIVDGENTFISLASNPKKDVQLKVSSKTVNNIFTNPSFETTAWESGQWGYPTFTRRSSEQALFGDYSAKITNNTHKVESASLAGYRILVEPSTTYTISGYVKNIGGVFNNTNPGLYAAFKTYTAANGYIATHPASSAAVTINVQDWIFFSFTETTESNAANIVFTLSCPNNGEYPGVAWYLDGMMMAPGTEILPFSEGGVSENITLNINGVDYAAEDGDIITIPGITTDLEIMPSIDGSRVATIEISGGTEVMASNGMLFDYAGDSLTVAHNKYGADTILWSSAAKLDISTFTGSAHTLYLNCSVPIIMQFEPYSEHLSWVANWTGYSTQDYILTGFEANETYQLDVDGTYDQSVKADEYGVLSFSFEGTGSTHIFEVTKYWLNSSMDGMMLIIVPVMVVTVLVGSVTALFGKFKR